MAAISSTLRHGETAPAAAEPDRDAVALRVFFRLVELWGLSMEQARVLLGRPSRATLYNWKAGRAKSLPHDTLRRISYLLGIYKALQVLYQDPALADAWLTRPNAALGGQSALERMLAGDVTDLAAVRAHLDAARGAWT
jgi:Antitoxin Xre-like helix-turn-helix domain/Antitoxin Xre/MbcA/ParS C-terminal toxin-binding domain